MTELPLPPFAAPYAQDDIAIARRLFAKARPGGHAEARIAARTVGAPSRLVSLPIVPCGVSPGWITRADMPSAQAEALTRKALDLVS